MRILFTSVAILVGCASLLIQGCGNNGGGPKPTPAARNVMEPANKSITGYWRYTGRTFNDVHIAADPKVVEIVDYRNDGTIYFLVLPNDETKKIIWDKTHTFTLNDKDLKYNELGNPSEDINFEVVQADKTKLRLKAKVKRSIPAGTVFEYDRLGKFDVDQMIHKFEAKKKKIRDSVPLTGEFSFIHRLSAVEAQRATKDANPARPILIVSFFANIKLDPTVSGRLTFDPEAQVTFPGRGTCTLPLRAALIQADVLSIQIQTASKQAEKQFNECKSFVDEMLKAGTSFAVTNAFELDENDPTGRTIKGSIGSVTFEIKP
jgi:hypothetical protein